MMDLNRSDPWGIIPSFRLLLRPSRMKMHPCSPAPFFRRTQRRPPEDQTSRCDLTKPLNLKLKHFTTGKRSQRHQHRPRQRPASRFCLTKSARAWGNCGRSLAVHTSSRGWPTPRPVSCNRHAKNSKRLPRENPSSDLPRKMLASLTTSQP